MVNNVISVRGLTVVRSGRPVLDRLDLEIGSGVTGLLGPSGCGKSTLLRSIVGVQEGAGGGGGGLREAARRAPRRRIVGVQEVAGGEVRGLGESAGSAPLRKRVGYVTQAASVYDDLTVSEN